MLLVRSLRRPRPNRKPSESSAEAYESMLAEASSRLCKKGVIISRVSMPHVQRRQVAACEAPNSL